MRMREIMTIVEAHHAYPEPFNDATFQALKRGDTIRVYHGFRELDDAITTCRHGLSGKERVPRVFSFESDNNPYGLFVTPSLKAAAEFTGAYEDQAIIEFTASEAELEAPVWPGGGYTVQGQMAQQFGMSRAGRLKRRQKGIADDQEAEAWASRQGDEHHRQSDRKNLARSLLSMGREPQALFVNHLNPTRITAVHIRPAPARHNDPWIKLSREDFLARYADRKPHSHNAERQRDSKKRLFAPEDEFNPQQFLAAISTKFRRDMTESLKDAWEDISEAPRPSQRFLQTYSSYLWPKQYAAAMLWMRDTFG